MVEPPAQATPRPKLLATVSLRIRSETHSALAAAAEAHGLTVSDLIRHASNELAESIERVEWSAIARRSPSKPPRKNARVRVIVTRLEPDLAEEFEGAAKGWGCSVSAVVSAALAYAAEHIQHLGPPPNAEGDGRKR